MLLIKLNKMKRRIRLLGMLLLLLTGCSSMVTVVGVEESKNVQIDSMKAYRVLTSDGNVFHTLRVYKLNDTIR